MENIEYHIKIWEKRKKKAQFQIISAAIILFGLMVGILWNLFGMDKPMNIPYGPLGLTTVVILLFFITNLSSWTNYSFLYHYFCSQWVGHQKPEQLELMTGTIESMQTVIMPYAGAFKQITVQLRDGQTISLYVKPHQLKKTDQTQPIRFLTYHMFIYEVRS